eukprot:6184321-Pleurochrysis_carterae.AAC.1
MRGENASQGAEGMVVMGQGGGRRREEEEARRKASWCPMRCSRKKATQSSLHALGCARDNEQSRTAVQRWPFQREDGLAKPWIAGIFREATERNEAAIAGDKGLSTTSPDEHEETGMWR